MSKPRLIGRFQMSKLETIDDAICFVTSRKVKSQGLDHFLKVLETLGNPQEGVTWIHVAGTNGKGSVSYLMAKLLESQGYRVGLFTSPHLESHLDRIRINDVWIEEEFFLNTVKKYEDFFVQEGLCMFEIDVIIALLYFQANKIDYGVLETGIGGRFDPTNFPKRPSLKIITTIGLDHQALLGNTLEQIAYQKAGIIQPNDLVVVGYLDDASREVVKSTCIEQKASFYELVKLDVNRFDQLMMFDHVYKLPTNTKFQLENAALTLYAYSLLKFDVKDKKVEKVLETTVWKGRFEVLQDCPTVILDGAHNLPAIHVLLEALEKYPRPWVGVFIGMKDKDIDQELALLQKAFDTLIVSQLDMERCKKVEEYNESYIKEKDADQAILKAKQLASTKGTVVLFGSLYFVSYVKTHSF